MSLQLGRDVAPAPSVVKWYRLYCVGMVLLYVGCIIVGYWLLDNVEDDEDRLVAMVYICMGIPLGLIYLAALLLPRRRWAWIVHLVLICGGMTSGCCLPICIPLLIHWIKPATKAFFGYS